MLEFLGSGIIGTLFGGLFRLVPEILKYMDKKGERGHELAMFDRQCDLEKVRGSIKMQEIGMQSAADTDRTVLDAFVESIKGQAEMAKAAGGWAAALSAMVRPFMAYYLLAMYGAVKLCLIVTSIYSGVTWHLAIPQYWTSEDMALLCGVVNFFILDRTLGKRGL